MRTHWWFLAAIAALPVVLPVAASGGEQPNILLVILDDMGWNDADWHYTGQPGDSTHIPTPVLRELKEQGIELSSHYVAPVCSPTRSALLTSRHPVRYGMQQLSLNTMYPFGVSTNETLLPQYLQRAGYRTHLVGKWHIGYHEWAYTPLHRGYHSHFGMFNSHSDFFTHKLPSIPMWDDSGEYTDLWRDYTPQKQYEGEYITFRYAEEAQRVVREHAARDSDEPLFLHLALQQVHEPIMVPQEAIERCPNIDNEWRATYCGMMRMAEDAIQNVTTTFKEEGLWENTLMIFFSDNGGWVGFGSNNLPLKGQKFTVFEGGVRSVSFLSGGFIPSHLRGTTYDGLMHVTDWLPTLMSAIGEEPVDEDPERPLDGVDQWDSILSSGQSAQSKSPRQEVLLNIDHYAWSPIVARGCALIRNDGFKLITGREDSQHFRLPANATDNPDPCPYDMFEVSPEMLRDSTCDEYDVFLYDLTRDPEERVNLAHDPQNRTVVDEMRARLREWDAVSVAPPSRAVQDPRAISKARELGAWAPWQGDDLAATRAGTGRPQPQPQYMLS